MGRRRPDWWSEQQQQQQQQHQQQQQRQQHQQEQQKREQDSGPVQDDGCPRNAANARERARMRVLSKAFGRLKTTLPWVPADTKLSKLDTLRLATTYIAHLSSLLAGTERSDAAAITATTATPAAAVVTSSNQPDYATTWPYNVHSSVDECSSPEDDYHRYDCYNTALMEPKSSYSTYETYYASSINS